MINIQNIFSTSERLKILKAVVFRTDPLSVNQLAKDLRLSKGLVSKYLDLLVREGAAKRVDGKYLVDSSAALVKGIKALLNLAGIELSFLKKHPLVEAAGLYGSCVRGENTEDSDVDLWIRVREADTGKQAALAAEFRSRIKNVKVLFLSGEKIKKLRKEDEVFYHALSFGSVILYGAANALEL